MIKLNLLPPKEKSRLLERKNITLTIRACLSFLGIILTFFVLLLLIWNFSNSEVKIIEEELTKTKNAFKQASLDELQNQIKEINQSITTVYSLQKNQLYFSLVLKEISNLTPQGITLESITILKNDPPKKSDQKAFYTLKITGLSPQRDLLLSYQEDLKKSDILTKLQSPLSNLLTQTDISFVLKAKIDIEKLKP